MLKLNGVERTDWIDARDGKSYCLLSEFTMMW